MVKEDIIGPPTLECTKQWQDNKAVKDMGAQSPGTGTPRQSTEDELRNFKVPVLVDGACDGGA
jgi:hypothetical protein